MQHRGRTRRTISHRLSLSLFLMGSVLIMTAGLALAQAKAATIDLNTASEKELESLKGVGPVMAKKIIAARPYNSVDELSKAGLPAKTIEGIKPLVTAGKPAAAPAAPTKAPAAPPPSASAPQKALGKSAGAAQAKLAPGQKVNLNTASKEQLEALPGIGPVKAQAIIDGRPYKKNDDIMKVKGIKEGIFSKIKDSITAE
jgi:competence protein ComEA